MMVSTGKERRVPSSRDARWYTRNPHEEVSMASRLTRVVLEQLARRGFVVRRHLGARRRVLLARHGVDVVFDVGAAKGQYGRELRQFGYDGAIVSFEPMAAPYEELAAAAAGDPRWSARHCALGRDSGTATINVASKRDSSSLLPMNDTHRAAAPQVDYVGTEEVIVERLDDVAAEALPSGATGFLKLDTQGFERDVLAGAEQTLPRCAGLQLELSFVALYDGAPLAPELLTFAYDHGFRMVGVDPGFASPSGEVLQAEGLLFREGDR
jgi:FkbM family methyltransferase